MNFGQPPPNTTAAASTGFTFGAPASASGGFSFGGAAGETKAPGQVSFGGFGEAAKAPSLFGNLNPPGGSAAPTATVLPRAGAGDSTFSAVTSSSQQPTFGAFQPLAPPATTTPATTAGITFGNPTLNTTSTFGLPTSQPGATTLGATAPFGIGTQPPSFTPTATVASQQAPAATISSGLGLTTPASQTSIQATNTAASISLTSNTPTGGFSFAAPTTSLAPMLGGKTLGSSPPTTSLLGKTPAPTTSTSFAPIALSTETKTTQSSSVKQSQQINFCKLEELVNKWNQALDEQEKLFTNQATQLNAWDQLLIENGEKLVALNEAVVKVKVEQTAVEQELEFIAAQHIELEECIIPLQKELAKTPQIDVERSQIYSIAENLDTQLKQMTEDLKAVIEQLNEANKAQDPNDPIVQIGRILNAHLNSMQWIETSTSLIGNKLDDITKVHEMIKRDNEKTMRRYFH